MEERPIMDRAKETKTARSANGSSTTESLSVEGKDKRAKRRRLIRICVAIVVLIAVLFAVVLVLALTVFKPKNPRMEIVSAAVSGVSPRVSLPAVRVELNVTLDLKILVRNRNYASFRHGTGASELLYRGSRVGEAELLPGDIPARGSTTVQCRLTLEVEELGSDLRELISDVLAGELEVEATTRIPGRVTFLGFIKKHVVAVSECRFTVGLGDLKIRSQDCKNKAKL